MSIHSDVLRIVRRPPTTHPSPGPHYHIHVQGHLTAEWSDWFDGLAIIPASDGTTFLEGPIADQAALYGLLTRLRDLGLTLISVNPHEAVTSRH